MAKSTHFFEWVETSELNQLIFRIELKWVQLIWVDNSKMNELNGLLKEF